MTILHTQLKRQFLNTDTVPWVIGDGIKLNRCRDLLIVTGTSEWHIAQTYFEWCIAQTYFTRITFEWCIGQTYLFDWSAIIHVLFAVIKRSFFSAAPLARLQSMSRRQTVNGAKP